GPATRRCGVASGTSMTPWRRARASPPPRRGRTTPIIRLVWFRLAGRTARMSLARALQLSGLTLADSWPPNDAPRGGSVFGGGVDGVRQTPPERVPAGTPVGRRTT